MSRLKTHLASVDHGTLSDLIGDAKIVELVNEISRSRDAKVERGDLILQVVGGPQALLESAQKRKVLFLSLNKTDRTTLMNALGISSLNSFKLTSERKPIIYEYFGCALPPERSEQEVGLPRVEILSPEYSLFAHQNSALQRSKSFFHSSLPRVMLHMPTGSGKTRTAMHLISNILNSREAGVVVWLVAGKELCQQASEEFERAWRSLGGRELPIVRLWSEVGDPSIPAHMIQQFANDKWPETLTDAMIIGSVDSVRNIVMSWEPSQRIGRRKNICLVVFDEAHRSVAKTYSETINSITDKSTALLGLSATPGRRHYGGEVTDDNKLVQMFAGQKVLLEIPGFDSPVDALVAMEYLAKLKKEQLPIASATLTKPQLAELQTSLETSLDLPEHLLRAFGLNATRNLQVVNRVEKLVLDEGHKRVIVFAASVEASIVIANILQARGIQSASITNQTPSYIRSQCISEYKKTTETPFVLTNFGVLTTGFDAPKTSAVVVARPTTSIVLLNQMAGRAIRGPKVKGNKEALLVTVVDTQVPELVETIRQFHAFDDSWKNSAEE